MPEKYPVRSAQVALTGNTYATLVPAPPAQVSYYIIKVFGQNNAGAARTLQLAFNNGGTRTVVWESASTADATMFAGSLGAENFPIDLVLANTDESLDMRLDDTGTDTIVCSYEVRES